MEIKYIKIEGLFSRFNHEIKFIDGVNIIIGDNGVGKTVCLKIIDHLFSSDFRFLFDLDFRQITISYGKEIWEISKQPLDGRSGLYSYYGSNLSKEFQIQVCNNLGHLHNVKYEDVRIDLPPFYEKISDTEWIDRRRGIVYEEREILNRPSVRKETKKLPDWITKRFKSISVRLIDTQRIYRNESNGRTAEIGRTISKNVKDIADVISREHSKAGVISAQLDRTFPSRLVNLLSQHPEVTPQDTLNRLTDIDDLNKALNKVGLTEYKNDSILKNLQQIDTAILTVLSLYADDMKKKLEAYSDIQGKLQLFLNIINSRFDNKQCVISKENEFKFITYELYGRTKRARELAPTLLSSGEQNEFVLFYELLFNCSEKNFILIDEPELSLHVKWQQKMIDDLLSICNQNKLNILIATHSPDLIGNHWSLVQKLE